MVIVYTDASVRQGHAGLGAVVGTEGYSMLTAAAEHRRNRTVIAEFQAAYFGVCVACRTGATEVDLRVDCQTVAAFLAAKAPVKDEVRPFAYDLVDILETRFKHWSVRKIASKDNMAHEVAKSTLPPFIPKKKRTQRAVEIEKAVGYEASLGQKAGKKPNSQNYPGDVMAHPTKPASLVDLNSGDFDNSEEEKRRHFMSRSKGCKRN